MPTGLELLIAIDGSPDAQAAVELVRDLPLPSASWVTALGVINLRNVLYTPGREGILAALDEAEAVLRGSSAQVRAETRYGHPAEQLSAYANERQPDLVVLGATGLRATPGIMLGGVAQQVVEYATWPVLVVRGPYLGLRRVLLAVDGSESGERAASFLARIPLPAGAQVEVVHVLPPALGAGELSPERGTAEGLDLGAAARAAASQNDADQRAGQAQLDRSIDLLGAHGRAAVGALRRGDAATELLLQARAQKVDLIVAGSRGLSGVQRWLLGSVSRKLVHYAACSVLIVRGAGD